MEMDTGEVHRMVLGQDRAWGAIDLDDGGGECEDVADMLWETPGGEIYVQQIL